MNMPSISIIVPVYQTEKYLSECVDSILAQSFTDFELLLIDDGSTDDSGLICDRYAQIDNRVKVAHKKNEGVSAARNLGLEICCGKYIAFVDADDTVDREFLEFAMQSMVGVQTDLFISGLSIEVWNNSKIDRIVRCGVETEQNYTIRELLENMDKTYPQICICVPVCKLYKRAIIEKYNIRFAESLNYGEDTYFNLDYYSYCTSVVFSREIFYHYRTGDGESLTGRFHRDTYEVHKKVWHKMRVLMQTVGCCKESMDWFETLYFEVLLGGIYEYYCFSEKTTPKERYEQIVKVAKDPYISSLRMQCISKWKCRILLGLLRLKWHWAVVLIYEIKYYRKNIKRLVFTYEHNKSC